MSEKIEVFLSPEDTRFFKKEASKKGLTLQIYISSLVDSSLMKERREIFKNKSLIVRLFNWLIGKS